VLIPANDVEVGVTEIFPSERILWVQLGGNAKFLDRSVPFALHRVGMSQVVARSRLCRRLMNCVTPERNLATVQRIPLVREDTEHEQERNRKTIRTQPNQSRSSQERHEPLYEPRANDDDS